uniref:Rec21/ENK19 domain-containing protein n=1 Tax=Panthera leo TaxID=9689 RepID=A0A8C8Y0Q2_PANLE
DVGQNLNARKRRPCLRTTKANDVTWGQLKKLDQNATEVMHHVGAPPTPENRFLAYLAVVSQNLAKVMFFLIFLFIQTSIAFSSFHWANIIDPPLSLSWLHYWLVVALHPTTNH